MGTPSLALRACACVMAAVCGACASGDRTPAASSGAPAASRGEGMVTQPAGDAGRVAGGVAGRAAGDVAGSAARGGRTPAAGGGGTAAAAGAGTSGGDAGGGSLAVDVGGMSGAQAGAGAPGTRMYGFTLDSVDDLEAIVDSLQRLPKRALVRIVFDYPEPPGSYTQAVHEIGAVADLVGQPIDSTYSSKLSVSEYAARFEAYLSALGSIEIWEACNECNGAWGGPNTAAQASAAYQIIRAHGKRVLFTPYWNGHDCEDENGDYIAWTRDHISDELKQGADFVTISIYGVDCTGAEPSYAELDAMFQTFGAMFPSAKLGIGEYGAKKSADKQRVLEYYLDYRSNDPRYIFWGGYWYGRQDFVPASQPLWQVFADAMK